MLKFFGTWLYYPLIVLLAKKTRVQPRVQSRYYFFFAVLMTTLYDFWSWWNVLFLPIIILHFISLLRYPLMPMVNFSGVVTSFLKVMFLVFFASFGIGFILGREVHLETLVDVQLWLFHLYALDLDEVPPEEKQKKTSEKRAEKFV